jgi:hypothetical protein
MVKAAEADAEAKFLQGQGMARQRQAIISGLRDSVVDFGNAVGALEAEGIDASSSWKIVLLAMLMPVHAPPDSPLSTPTAPCRSTASTQRR